MSSRVGASCSDRARNNPKIQLITNAVVDEILGATAQAGGDRRAPARHPHGQPRELACGRRVMPSGINPQASYPGQAGHDEGRLHRTRRDRPPPAWRAFFACGDVADHVYRAGDHSSGTGCMAAIDVERFLAMGR